MPSNLPENQKTNWLTNEVVMPTDTNGWGTAINKLKKAIPIYASCGNFYRATYSNNIYQLTPLTLSDNTTNEVVSEYVEGMSIVFQCPADNLANCSINVNSLGVKSIKSVYNTNLEAGILKQGAFIELKFDKTNNYFKFEQDLSKAGINLDNITASGRQVIDTRIDTKLANMLELLYPIGSVYIGTQATCPLETLGIGTWLLKSAGSVLQGSDSNHLPGSSIEPGLPTLTSSSEGGHFHNKGTMEIYGDLGIRHCRNNTNNKGISTISNTSGAFFYGSYEGPTTSSSITYNGVNSHLDMLGFKASRQWKGVTNTTGAHTHTVNWDGHVSETVQPKAYVVNIWERVA